MATVAELGARVKAKHPEYADLPDDEVGRRVKAKFPGQYDDFADSTTTSGPQLIRTPNLAQRLGNVATAELPFAGGLAGGISGAGVGVAIGAPFAGVGAIPGAAIGGTIGGIAGAFGGGAAGKGLQQRLSGHKTNTGEMAAAGGEQAAYEVAGMGLGRIASKAARPLMKKALGIAPSILERFGMTADQAAEFALGKRAPVSQAGKTAVAEFNDAVRLARSQAISSVRGTAGASTLSKKAIADAEAALGRPMTKAEKFSLIVKVQSAADDILAGRTHGVVPKASHGTPAQAASTIVDQYGKPAIAATPATAGAPSRYTAREFEQIKEVAAKQARPQYAADAAAKSVAADPALSKQIASSARATLSRFPGVKGYNNQLRQGMAVEQGIKKALNKSGEWTPVHIGPVSLGLKLSPEKLSNVALLLTNPKFQAYTRNSPRAAAALVAAMLHSQEPDTVGTEASH